MTADVILNEKNFIKLHWAVCSYHPIAPLTRSFKRLQYSYARKLWNGLNDDEKFNLFINYLLTMQRMDNVVNGKITD